MLDTFPDARIATVPVPLKFTHARQAYIGAEPEAFRAVVSCACVMLSVVVASVPVASGSVSVRLVLVAGDATVNVAVPAALPAMVMFDMACAPYTTVQTDPDGTVTEMPELMVTGPALIAFLPDVMV